MKYLKSYNESIKNLLKPKNIDTIKNQVKYLNIEKKMVIACKYDLDWLAQECIDEGYDLTYMSLYFNKIAYYNSINVLKVLIENNISIDILDVKLFKVVENNNLEMIKLMVDYGCDLYFEDEIEYKDLYVNLLEMSVLKCDIKMVKFLLDNNVYKFVDIDVLEKALSENKYDIIKLLISEIPYVKKNFERIYNDHMKNINLYNESISSFLKPRSSDDLKDKIKNLSPTQKLLKGAEYDLLWLVEEAIKEGADPSFDDQSAFNIACDYGNIEIVQYLLKDERVDPSDMTGFMWALESEHYNILKLLLNDKRVDPTINDNEAIIYASNTQNYKAVEILLNDDRVKNSLNKSQLNYYTRKIKK